MRLPGFGVAPGGPALNGRGPAPSLVDPEKLGIPGKNGPGGGASRKKTPDRAPSFVSATAEDHGQGVDGLVAAATQTALFTAASSRT